MHRRLGFVRGGVRSTGLRGCLGLTCHHPPHQPLTVTQAYETADGKLDTKKREAALLARYQEVRGRVFF